MKTTLIITSNAFQIGNIKFKGTNKGNLYNAKDICKEKFTNLLNPECYPWWKFWDADDSGNEQWTYDNNVKVNCFGKYNILTSIKQII